MKEQIILSKQIINFYGNETLISPNENIVSPKQIININGKIIYRKKNHMFEASDCPLGVIIFSNEKHIFSKQIVNLLGNKL